MEILVNLSILVQAAYPGWQSSAVLGARLGSDRRLAGAPALWPSALGGHARGSALRFGPARGLASLRLHHPQPSGTGVVGRAPRDGHIVLGVPVGDGLRRWGHTFFFRRKKLRNS